MRSVVSLFFILVWLSVPAQRPAKKPLSIEDFGSWNTLSNAIISNNGYSVAYVQSPQQGDGMLIIKHEKKDADTIPRGYNARFGPGNNFIVFKIKQPEEQIRKAKLDKVKKEDLPRDSIGIVVFTDTLMVSKFAGINSYDIPDENALWIVFSIEPDKSRNDSLPNDSDVKQKKKTAEDLVLFQVATADTIKFSDVSEWVYSESGSSVWFRRELKDSTGISSSVFVFNTLTGKVTLVFTGNGVIKKLVADEQGRQCAFLFSGDTISNKKYSLYAGTADNAPEKIVDNYTPGMPIGWSPNEHGALYFSEDGSKLFFGTAETPEPEPKDTLTDEEKPRLDIWSWHDDKLQSQQLLEVATEKKRSYLAVYHLNLKHFVQLADPLIREVSTIGKGNGEVAIGYNEHPYLRESGWTGKRSRDYYIIDVASGNKREIADCKSYVRLSPKGKYAVWYESSEKGYFARSTDINKLEAVAITQMIPVKFYDEENDRPNDPSPYGIAGWSEDDRFVYIYDRYDIWRIDPSGERVPVCITKTFGRRNKTRLRYLQLDPDLEYIPADMEIILNAFDERTMSGGFFSTRLNTVTDPRLLIMDKCHFSGVRAAKKGDRLIWSRESVKEFPDLWLSNSKFMDAEKISNANPQQEKFVWPKAQLVEWISFSGEKLNGLLYLPENMDPAKKYPVMVYFYERNSENLYRHQHPAPSRSVINKTFYVSNGYVVFVPDITYRTGYPGQSAFSAIMSGTQYLINTFPYLDETKMGLQGQSWGGYQVAYLITQTDLFAAAMAGAPVSNMTSAYGGIRWESGLVRMFQYEQQQSRIGGSLWEKPFHYIENSPLFSAPRINTPLLMMHNDNDGAVPWNQGIQFFVALRRLDKPVWMLNYNDEPHNLRASSWANRIDLSKRMFQFFNHYLKNQPMPEWMEKGVPALEKEINLGY